MSAKTIQNLFSRLKIFCGWLGKSGIISPRGAIGHLPGVDAQTLKVTTVADKSIWEGHSRDALPALVAASTDGRGNALAIARAMTAFVQNVCKGFSDSAFADRFLAEVAQGAVKHCTGKPAQLQTMARCILDSPDHIDLARALQQLKSLKKSHASFAEIEFDLLREYREAMRLAIFADPATGLIEITRQRTVVRSSMPTKFISTVHKAKGLESDHVLLLPCDKAHFGNTEEKRYLLYVALSRAKKSLTIVVSATNPSPWLIGP